MHQFLTFLARRTSAPALRYGVVIGSMLAVTLFRVAVPLDAAPFLLFLPVVFLLSVAFGTRAGLLATILSACAAASFFTHPGSGWWMLTSPQWVAIIEYLLVTAGMVRVCSALRKAISDREGALAQAMASEASLRSIVDTVPVGILFAEAPSGRIVRRNRRMEEIVGGGGGGSPKSIGDYGKWTASHADGRRVEAGEYPLARVIKGEVDEASLQVRYERRDGSLVWLDLVAAATKDAGGSLTGAVVAVSDVDARKQAELSQARMTEELRIRKDEAEAAMEAPKPRTARRARSSPT